MKKQSKNVTIGKSHTEIVMDKKDIGKAGDVLALLKLTGLVKLTDHITIKTTTDETINEETD
jgi:hypothetical protein